MNHHFGVPLIFGNTHMYTLPNIATCPTCSPRPRRSAYVKHNPGGVFQAFLDCLTLPETNIAPENRPLEKEIPIESYHFWEQTLSFRECNPCNPEPLGNDSQFWRTCFEPLDADVPPSLIRWINCGNMPFGTPWVLPFGAARIDDPKPHFSKADFARGSCLHSWHVFSAIHYKDVFEQNGMESSKKSRGNLDVSFCWWFLFIQSSFTGWLISIKKTSPWIFLECIFGWPFFHPFLIRSKHESLKLYMKSINH